MEQAELQVPAESIDLLAKYCQVLWHWNEQLNLTRHDDCHKFVTRDLVDTLELSQLITTGETVLDVGTGSGVPGLPLAILRPDISVCVCDSVAKRSKTVERMVSELKLPIPVYHAAGQSVVADNYFDVLVTRAVAPLAKLCTWFTPVRHNWGKMLVIKGPKWVEERLEAREKGLLKPFDLRKVSEYPRAEMDAPSVILCLEPRDR